MCCFNKVNLSAILLVHKRIIKWSRYRPGVAHRVGRGIAQLFHDRGTGRGWVVSSTPWPHCTPGKDPVPILQEAWWAPGPVWTGGKSRPYRDSIPDRPARSQSLYRLSYRAHNRNEYHEYFLGSKGGRYGGWRPYHLQASIVWEVWELQPPGNLMACPGHYTDCITFALFETCVFTVWCIYA